jgi:carbon-monoxide dehydrogenase medium subunit
MVSQDESGFCREARLVYLNAGDGPVHATQASARLVGERHTHSAIEEAARIAAETEVDPPGNIHASPDYQRHLVAVLTKRALELAFARADASLAG